MCTCWERQDSVTCNIMRYGTKRTETTTGAKKS